MGIGLARRLGFLSVDVPYTRTSFIAGVGTGLLPALSFLVLHLGDCFFLSCFFTYCAPLAAGTSLSATLCSRVRTPRIEPDPSETSLDPALSQCTTARCLYHNTHAVPVVSSSTCCCLVPRAASRNTRAMPKRRNSSSSQDPQRLLRWPPHARPSLLISPTRTRFQSSHAKTSRPPHHGLIYPPIPPSRPRKSLPRGGSVGAARAIEEHSGDRGLEYALRVPAR